MLSYQHGYHAGCIADVIKHLLLTRVLSYLTQKPKSLFYLDTHSGSGLYDLRDKKSLKTKEAEAGIHLLWEKRTTLSPLCEPYLEILEKCNDTQALCYYPGSPKIAIESLRKDDRLFFYERHPHEFTTLKQLPKLGHRVFYRLEDGLSGLEALLPPTERRGLIFMDPAYEIKTEYREIPEAIGNAYKRFSTGVYCLWYPWVDEHYIEQLARGMGKIKAEYLRLDCHWDGSTGMQGCGLWLLNPPYVLKDEMHEIMQSLRKIFASLKYQIQERSVGGVTHAHTRIKFSD